MRFVVYLLTALCLSALSFPAAANARVDASVETAMSVGFDEVIAAATESLDAVILPGDDPLEAEEVFFDHAPPPGYCNIWSADLLDPLDMLDEIEESSALFVMPPLPPVDLPLAMHVAPLDGRMAGRPDGLLRPPNPLA